MGIGIIGVMLSHYFKWTNCDNLLTLFCKPFIGLVYTEGFLILSGYGLCYSYIQNDNKHFFWIKRINRLLIPFVLMCLPFCLCGTFGESIWDSILELSTLRFWFFGNSGMWYISVSLLLYFLFPYLFDFCFAESKFIIFRVFLLILIFYMVPIILYFFCNSYYNITYIGYTQMPAFIWGMCLGYLSYYQIEIKWESLIFAVLITLTILLNLKDGILGQFGNGLLRLTCILVLCPIMSIINSYKIVNLFMKLLSWIGQYSLELYILHMLVYLSLYRFLYSPEFSILITLLIAPFVHKCTNRVWIKYEE